MSDRTWMTEPGNRRDRARFAALDDETRAATVETARRLYDGTRTVARCWTEALAMSVHTADTCTIETHDHFGQQEQIDNHDAYPCFDGSDELRCNDCGAAMFYDYADEQYHHLDPARSCFMIPAAVKS